MNNNKKYWIGYENCENCDSWHNIYSSCENCYWCDVCGIWYLKEDRCKQH